jgi:hypothetical protein
VRANGKVKGDEWRWCTRGKSASLKLRMRTNFAYLGVFKATSGGGDKGSAGLPLFEAGSGICQRPHTFKHWRIHGGWQSGHAPLHREYGWGLAPPIAKLIWFTFGIV